MTLIDVICKGRAFSRGWETPNDRFPLPVAQSLTQFCRKFVVFFLFISDHHLSSERGWTMRGSAGLLLETVGVCCASCVKVMNVGQWSDGDSWFVTQGTTGGLRSWHWAQGRDRRESPSLWLRKAVPDWRLPLCQGGGQAWAHRPSWYLLATWQALNMSCYCLVPPSQFVKGNSVTRPGRGNAEALREAIWCCFSPHTLFTHPAPFSERDHSRYFGLIRNKKNKGRVLD